MIRITNKTFKFWTEAHFWHRRQRLDTFYTDGPLIRRPLRVFYFWCGIRFRGLRWRSSQKSGHTAKRMKKQRRDCISYKCSRGASLSQVILTMKMNEWNTKDNESTSRSSSIRYPILMENRTITILCSRTHPYYMFLSVTTIFWSAISVDKTYHKMMSSGFRRENRVSSSTLI